MRDDALISTLGELAAVKAGHPFRGSIPSVPGGDIRAVQLKDISRDGLINWDSTVATRLEGWKEPDWLKSGDVLFMFRGTRTLAVYIDRVPFQAVCSPNFYLIRVADESVLPEFLAWQLNQAPAQNSLRQGAEGSAQLHIRRAVVENIELTIPPLSTQTRIVLLASSARKEAAILEKLIENRSQMLHALAQDVLHVTKGRK